MNIALRYGLKAKAGPKRPLQNLLAFFGRWQNVHHVPLEFVDRIEGTVDADLGDAQLVQPFIAQLNGAHELCISWTQGWNFSEYGPGKSPPIIRRRLAHLRARRQRAIFHAIGKSSLEFILHPVHRQPRSLEIAYCPSPSTRRAVRSRDRVSLVSSSALQVPPHLYRHLAHRVARRHTDFSPSDLKTIRSIGAYRPRSQPSAITSTPLIVDLCAESPISQSPVGRPT